MKKHFATHEFGRVGRSLHSRGNPKKTLKKLGENSKKTFSAVKKTLSATNKTQKQLCTLKLPTRDLSTGMAGLAPLSGPAGPARSGAAGPAGPACPAVQAWPAASPARMGRSSLASLGWSAQTGPAGQQKLKQTWDKKNTLRKLWEN